MPKLKLRMYLKEENGDEETADIIFSRMAMLRLYEESILKKCTPLIFPIDWFFEFFLNLTGR